LFPLIRSYITNQIPSVGSATTSGGAGAGGSACLSLIYAVKSNILKKFNLTT
jgi:hypothetical protein